MTFSQKVQLIFRCFRLAGPFGLIAGVKYCLGLLAIDEIGLESSVFIVEPGSEAVPAAELPDCFRFLRPKKGRFDRRPPDGRNALGWKID